MKKSDTEQEQPGLEENKVPDSQSKRELDRELQELAEKEHQEEIYYEERRRERHERNLKRKKRQIRNRNLALIITALAVLGGVGYFYREQTGLKDGMETLVAKVRDLVPDKNSGKESKAAEELAKADQSTESIENPESTENPDINTEEAADSSDSTDIQPESGEGTADDSDEMTGNTADNSENTAQGESGNVSDEEKTEDNSSDSVNQPEQEAEQEAAQAAAIDLNGVMPQAAAAGAGIIRRQIRHEKKVLVTAKEKAAQYDYDGAIQPFAEGQCICEKCPFSECCREIPEEKG